MDTGFWVLIGFVLIILASLLEAFCAFSRLAKPDFAPGILKGWSKWVLETLWVLMLLGGGSLLFLFAGAIPALAAVFGFWLILPFLITPIMRRRLLPPWDEVKADLILKDYNEHTYWRGDWWMKPEKQRKNKNKTN